VVSVVPNVAWTRLVGGDEAANAAHSDRFVRLAPTCDDCERKETEEQELTVLQESHDETLERHRERDVREMGEHERQRQSAGATRSANTIVTTLRVSAVSAERGERAR
jgi:hypothetical protein